MSVCGTGLTLDDQLSTTGFESSSHTLSLSLSLGSGGRRLEGRGEEWWEGGEIPYSAEGWGGVGKVSY